MALSAREQYEYFLECVDAGSRGTSGPENDETDYLLFEVFDTAVISFFHASVLQRLRSWMLIDDDAIELATVVRARWLDISAGREACDGRPLRAMPEWSAFAAACHALQSHVRRPAA